MLAGTVVAEESGESLANVLVELGSWVVFFRSGFRECRPAVFVNVRPAPSWLLETLPTDDVQAVEVYRDPWVPGEFKQFNRCGAINMWTGRS